MWLNVAVVWFDGFCFVVEEEKREKKKKKNKYLRPGKLSIMQTSPSASSHSGDFSLTLAE